MTAHIRRLIRLSRLWFERAQPEGQSPRDALLLAETLATGDAVDPAAMALAWRTVAEMYGVLGWEISISPELARCRSAAESARHTAWTTVERVLEAVPEESPPVLLLGELGLAAAVLEEVDVLPASGALLVPIEGGRDADASATGLHAASGVRWVKPGRLVSELAEDLPSMEIGGRRFRLPSPALAASLAAAGAAAGRSTDVILFAAAWTRMNTAAAEMENEPARPRLPDRVLETAWRLGVAPNPGLLTRIRFGLRTLAQGLAPTR